MSINLQNWPTLAFIAFLLVLAGAGDYLHIVPAGTLASLLLFAIGLVAPSPLLHAPAAAPAPAHVDQLPPTPPAAAAS